METPPDEARNERAVTNAGLPDLVDEWRPLRSINVSTAQTRAFVANADTGRSNQDAGGTTIVAQHAQIAQWPEVNQLYYVTGSGMTSGFYTYLGHNRDPNGGYDLIFRRGATEPSAQE